MKTYDKQTYIYATSRLNKMLNAMRKIKNGTSIKEACVLDGVEENDIIEFLDKIEVEFADSLKDDNSFDKLITNNVFRGNSLKPLQNMGLNSLNDFTKYTISEFSHLAIRPQTKIKLLELMITNNIIFKDSTIEDMSNLMDFAKAIENVK